MRSRLSVRYFINRLFAGGSYYDIFPLRGPVSANFDITVVPKITDYLWHITLPVLATVIGGFAALTMLTKIRFSTRCVNSMSLPLALKA